MWTFEFYQSISKKVILAGLNSLWQKNCQVSVKIWIFDDPISKKGPILVILVPGMIQPSGSVIFWWNETVEVNEATEVDEAVEVIEAEEDLRSGWGLQSYPGSRIQLYFDFLKKYCVDLVES